jgi:hypothetical protein
MFFCGNETLGIALQIAIKTMYAGMTCLEVIRGVISLL